MTPDTSTADRLAIQDLIARYAVIVDSRDFDALDAVFTPDARIDFTAFGGPAGSPPEIRKFLADSLGIFKRTQHLMGLPLITIDGDRATARTPCTNPMVLDDAGSTKVWLIGLWYDDELVRTPDGWRFASRRQERCYSVVGLPDLPLGPA
jgi:ketosteroid isomerase-like protein